LEGTCAESGAMSDSSGGGGAGSQGSAPYTPAYQMAYFAHMQQQAQQQVQQGGGTDGAQQQQQQKQQQHTQQHTQQQQHGQKPPYSQRSQAPPQRVAAPQAEHLLQYQQYFKQQQQQQQQPPQQQRAQGRAPEAARQDGRQAFQPTYGSGGSGGYSNGYQFSGFPLMGGQAAAHFGAFGYQAPGVGPAPASFGAFGMAPGQRTGAMGGQEHLKKTIESEISAMIGIKPSQSAPGPAYGRANTEEDAQRAMAPVGGGRAPGGPTPVRAGQSLLYSDTPEEQLRPLVEQTQAMQLGDGKRRSGSQPRAGQVAADGRGGTDSSERQDEEEQLGSGQKKKRRGGQKKKKGKKEREKHEEEVIEYPPADPNMTGTYQSARSNRLLAKCPPITQEAIDKVTLAVLKVHSTLRPPESDLQKKRDLVKRLQAIVTAAFPNQNAEIHMFGSSANDFCLKRGDLDMCLTIDETTMKRENVIKKLAKVLETKNMKELLALPRARIPIVKFVDPRRKLSCDICVNNTLALENTRLLGDYASIDPRMRQLVFVVKRWAKQRSINDCYMRTLSSYAYVLLVIHFLQIQQPPVLPCLQQLGGHLPPRVVQGYDCRYADNVEELVGFGAANEKPVGLLLIEFFKFYAFSFDYQRAVVSVRTGGFLSKEAKKWTQSKPKLSILLTIEDPFEVTHNLGRSVDAQGLKAIRAEFERAYTLLAKSGNLWQVLEKYEDQ